LDNSVIFIEDVTVSYKDNIVDRILEMVGLSHLAHRPIGCLSGGEQQKTAIARSLVQEPDLILLDEPIASLDWRAKIDIIQLVKSIHGSHHLTTLFVTHDLSALPLTCDRVLLIKNGSVWDEGAPDLLITDDNLSRLYDLPLPIVKQRRAESALAW
jgi:ABC-type cobalamin/Fe3+-siderophores transport system ATPase subunit